MTTIYTFIGATVVGILLFTVILPRVLKRLEGKVLQAKKLDEELKENILGLLHDMIEGKANRKPKAGEWVLQLIFLFLLGLQIYLLHTGQGSGARIVMIGMFVLFTVHVLDIEEEEPVQAKRH